MSNTESDPFCVVASLRAGPAGKVRVGYDLPFRRVLADWSHRLRSGGKRAYDISPVIEIDRAKLRRLKFSQQELAEIGFGLVMNLAVLDKALDRFRDEESGRGFGGEPSSAA
jgi:hypothetical protein